MQITRIFPNMMTAIKDLFRMVVIQMPGQTGLRLRQSYYKKKLKYMGEAVRIERGVFIQCPEQISLGDNCWIDIGVILLAGKACAGDGKKWRLIKGKNIAFEGELVLGRNIHISPYCTVSGMGGLQIGDNTSIGAKTSIYTHTQISKKPNILFSNGLTIGQNVLIGTNSTILGVNKIDDGTILKPATYLSEIFVKKKDPDSDKSLQTSQR